jgi:pSer/pThr/pTyr-binding forkhead associated (FHA) protein
MSRWQLVVLASDGSEADRFPLREGDNLVGSASPGEGIHPDVDLGPFDPTKNVSRQHAVISVRGDHVFLADHPGDANRGSRNGTWVDGVRITATPVEVTERSDIAFAQLRFRVRTRA